MSEDYHWPLVAVNDDGIRPAGPPDMRRRNGAREMTQRQKKRVRSAPPKFSSSGRQRLIALADYLDDIPQERFRFSVWVGSNWGGKADLSCGTQACAVGWATTMPEFRRLGLRLARDKEGIGFITMVGTRPKRNVYEHTIEITRRFFRITKKDVYRLFIPRGCTEEVEGQLNNGVGPRDVATNIRKFLLEKWT